MRVIGLVELLVAMVAVAGTVHLSPRVAVVPKKQVAKATSPSSPGPSSGSLSTMVSSSSSSSRLGRKRSARAAPVLQEEGQDPEDRAPRAGFRVVTDIDDTVKSSGGKNIFGIYLGGVTIALTTLTTLTHTSTCSIVPALTSSSTPHSLFL